MSRNAGLALVVIGALVIVGCGTSKPEPSPPAAPAEVSSETAPAASADQSTRDTASEAPAAGEPMGAGAEETKPTALGAIGRAVRSSLGVSDDSKSSEAPAYRPQ